jgi:plastocyanin
MVPTMKRVNALIAVAAISLPVALGACGGDDKGSSGATATPSANGDLQVVAKDIKFDSKTYTMATGLHTIELDNKGSLSHSLVIEQDGKKVDDFRLATNAKKTASDKVNLPPGTYTIYCDIPGHRAQGMEATLTVK